MDADLRSNDHPTSSDDLRRGTLRHAAFVLEDVAILDLMGNSHPATFPAVIDTGADRSVIPLDACADLKLRARGWRKGTGFDLSSQIHPIYAVQLAAPGLPAVMLPVFAVTRQSILLGRDFLRNFCVVVDFAGGTGSIGSLSTFQRAALRIAGL